MARVRWTRRALQNLDDAPWYVAAHNPEAAAELVTKIVLSVNRLSDFPSAGRGRVPGTRELVIADTHYLAPYRVERSVVSILRVFHSARKWPPHP